MCVYPASAPALSHPAWPCLLSLLMGVTNGYFGSVPMIQAAGKVPPEQRELAGETHFPSLCLSCTSRKITEVIAAAQADTGTSCFSKNGSKNNRQVESFWQCEDANDHRVPSVCPTREHHDRLLHDRPDGGLHRSVRSLQLHCSGISGTFLHTHHTHTYQRHRVLIVHTQYKTDTYKQTYTDLQLRVRLENACKAPLRGGKLR